ncbi:MAG: efflux RND transporter periplasmic adaptor subunit [Patescibacteria group bacterium]|nr:efflux RND transporter periplasmic adaptor subunit [Patescibacteria group bacterium]MDE2015305.1 efflux RND transporter periplasmic adaptor subunit [Patescibacteria group bacterium]MDE2227110.1 efflux RND transporter periplasmic adaptor subunit [Patescibacteria group bacterium]
MLKNIFKKIIKRKILSAIVLVGVCVGVYFSYNAIKGGSGGVLPQYVTANAQVGTLVVSVSGSGQMAASSQVDIKPKVSGDVTWVGVAAGNTVHSGQALVRIDDTTALQAVTNAEQSLATSRLQYQQAIAQAPIDYQNAINALASAKTSLSNQYNTTFNILSSTYLDLPGINTGMYNILYGTDLDQKNGKWNVDSLIDLFQNQDNSTIISLANIAKSDYAVANNKYNSSVTSYKQITRSSSGSDLESLLGQSIDTAASVAQTLQDELNLLGGVTDLAKQYGRTLPNAINTLQTNARNYLTSMNSDLSSLLSQQQSINSDEQAITTDQQNITLLQVGNPTNDNPISLQISKNNLAAQEQSLADLKTALSDYTITAPFDGTISAVNVNVGDTLSGAVATIVSTKQLAQATFNEVDIVNVKIGQKASVTFDALPNLTLTGKVAEVDPVGTVSQGVVSYKVQVALDDNNQSVKPGMSDTVEIITNAKQNALLIPNSAITTRQGISYVQIIGADGVPIETQVTTGLFNDTETEILSGLKESDKVVTQTVAAKTTTQSTVGATGGNARFGGGGGGGLRVLGL